MGDETALAYTERSPWWLPRLAECVAELARSGGEPDPEHEVFRTLATCGVDEMAHVRNLLTDLRRALRAVSAEVDRLIAADVATFGPVRLGDLLYTTTRASDRKVLPNMADALFDYLGEDLRRCVNPSAVKITGLRTVAELRGHSPEAVEDTFYERTYTTAPELAVVPVAQRKWAQALKDGERGRR